MLLRPPRRRAVRRFVFLCALFALFTLAPTAGGVPGDETPPVVRPIYSPPKPANGWWRGPVTLNWSRIDPESIITAEQGCDARTLTADTAGTEFTCTAWSDGGKGEQTISIKMDKTLPSVSATPQRVPDASGWYNRALTVSFTGVDVTSGIATCTSSQYAGPDSGNAVVTGSCTDVAGNVASASHAFKYDSTPPKISNVRVNPRNRSARVSWTASSDTQTVEVARAPGRNDQRETVVYRGTAVAFTDSRLAVGRRYRYRVIGIDQAMNRTEQSALITATGALFSPLPGAQVKSPPRLAWAPLKKATYYNVQLIRNGRKILSAWPLRPTYRLRRTWSYEGRRYRLRPGTYRWYVWPGLGPISAARYARQALGSSTFVVAK